jgi:hypothetical protein
MEQHAGIDVSLEWSSVCIVDASGKIVKELRSRANLKCSSNSLKGLASPLRGSGSKRVRSARGAGPGWV